MSKSTGGKGFQRLSLAAIPIVTVLAMVGFWRLAPGVTFVLAVLALLALIVFLWAAGKEPN